MPPPTPKTETEAEIRARAQDLLSAANLIIMLSWPYLTSATMRLLPRWTDKVPTMAVDQYYRLYLNPTYVSKLKATTLAVLIAGHELQHVLGDHHQRMLAEQDEFVMTPKGIQGTLANLCQDLAINSGLKDYVDSAVNYRAANGHTKLEFSVPTDGVFPEHFKFGKAFKDHGKPLPYGLLPEQYCEILKDSIPQCSSPKPGGSGDGTGKPGGKELCCGSGGGAGKQSWEEGPPDPNDPNTGVDRLEAEKINKQVAQAAEEQAEKSRGTVPGHMRSWAKVTLTPSKIPWQQVLKAAVRAGMNWAAGRSEFTWTRPSRRSPPDVILPGTYEPEPDVVLAIDRSGSMLNELDDSRVFREVAAVFRSLGRRKVPVFTVDSEVYEVQYVDDLRQLKLTGGGGTDMTEAIHTAVRMKKKMVIIISDGITPWSCGKPTGTRVVLALTRPPSKNYPTPEWIKTVHCYDNTD